MGPRSFTAGLSLAAALLGAGCSSAPEVLMVRSGTSFGFCPPTAYCETQLQVTSSTATFLRATRAGGPVVVTGAVTAVITTPGAPPFPCGGPARP
jgi:hypothetical protein